jgi:glycerophosphoryl diester phosphodiesterase
MTLEIIAHRGFSSIAPENTMSAFHSAIAFGSSAAIGHNADSIEFDLQLSADGVPIIFHDQKLDRITGKFDKVREKNWEYLQQIDAGTWFSQEFAREKIPSFAEALKTLKNVKKYLYFDVKPYYEWSISDIENLVNIIINEGVQDKCIITSFNEKFLEKFRQVSPEFIIGHIVANEEIYLTQLEKIVKGCDKIISSEYHVLLKNPSLIEKSRSYGVDIVAWTVDDRDDLQQLMNLGIERIVTNSLIG